jgi:hypothetical protein
VPTASTALDPVTDTERLAALTGQPYAEDIAVNVRQLPAVVIYSSKNLSLDHPGVREVQLKDRGSAYAFRYEGLRLLLRSGSTLVLLYDGWEASGGHVILLNDSEALRFEFSE